MRVHTNDTRARLYTVVGQQDIAAAVVGVGDRGQDRVANLVARFDRRDGHSHADGRKAQGNRHGRSVGPDQRRIRRIEHDVVGGDAAVIRHAVDERLHRGGDLVLDVDARAAAGDADQAARQCHGHRHDHRVDGLVGGGGQAQIAGRGDAGVARPGPHLGRRPGPTRGVADVVVRFRHADRNASADGATAHGHRGTDDGGDDRGGVLGQQHDIARTEAVAGTGGDHVAAFDRRVGFGQDHVGRYGTRTGEADAGDRADAHGQRGRDRQGRDRAFAQPALAVGVVLGGQVEREGIGGAVLVLAQVAVDRARVAAVAVAVVDPHPVADFQRLRACCGVEPVGLQARFVQHLGLHRHVAGTRRQVVVGMPDVGGDVIADLVVGDRHADRQRDARACGREGGRQRSADHVSADVGRVVGMQRDAVGDDPAGPVTVDARLDHGGNAVVGHRARAADRRAEQAADRHRGRARHDHRVDRLGVQCGDDKVTCSVDARVLDVGAHLGARRIADLGQIDQLPGLAVAVVLT